MTRNIHPAVLLDSTVELAYPDVDDVTREQIIGNTFKELTQIELSNFQKLKTEEEFKFLAEIFYFLNQYFENYLWYENGTISKDNLRHIQEKIKLNLNDLIQPVLNEIIANNSFKNFNKYF